MGMFFWVFFVNGKVLGIFSSSAPRRKPWIFFFFLTVQVFLNTSLAGRGWALEDVRSYFLQLKMGISHPAMLTKWNLEGSSAREGWTAPFSGVLWWKSFILCCFFLEYRHWSHPYVSPKRNDEKGNFHVHKLIKLTVLPMKDLQTKHPPISDV